LHVGLRLEQGNLVEKFAPLKVLFVFDFEGDVFEPNGCICGGLCVVELLFEGEALFDLV